jgi:hypothetical protein
MRFAGFEIRTDLWIWHAIKWIEFANPLTSDVSEAANLLACAVCVRLCAELPSTLSHSLGYIYTHYVQF